MVLYLVAVGASLTGATWVPRLSPPVVGVVVPTARSNAKLGLPAAKSTTQPAITAGGVAPPLTTSATPGASTPTTEGATDHAVSQAPAQTAAAVAGSASASAASTPPPGSSSSSQEPTTPGTTASPVAKTTGSGKTPPGQVNKSTQSNPGVTAPGRTKH